MSVLNPAFTAAAAGAGGAGAVYRTHLGAVGVLLELEPEHLAEEGYLHQLEVVPRVRDRILRPANTAHDVDARNDVNTHTE